MKIMKTQSTDVKIVYDSIGHVHVQDRDEKIDIFTKFNTDFDVLW